MRIYTLSPYRHVLVVVMDHIVADFYSLEIFKKELWALYFQELRGLPSPLMRPCMQFGDFAIWLEQTHALWKRDHEPYWTEKLAGCPRAIIPSMREGLVADTSAGSKSEFCFGERLSAAIAGLARSEKVLTPLVILTLYLLSMSSLCGTRDLLVRFVVNERIFPQLENIIGCLSGHLYLRVEIQQQDTLAGLLRKVSEEFHAANDHYDFGRVPEMFPDLRTDLYFNWYPTFDEQWLEGHQAGAAVPITMESLQIVEARSFDFPIFLFTEGPRGILGSIEYRPSLLATNVVEQLVSRMLSLAEDFSMSPLASVTPNLGAVAGAICP